MYPTRIETRFQLSLHPTANLPGTPAQLSSDATLSTSREAGKWRARPQHLPRCGQKACVYPVAGFHLSLCIHHLRERREPSLFLSCQPSLTLLDRARFGLVIQDDDTLFRSQDRQRYARERETFLEEAL